MRLRLVCAAAVVAAALPVSPAVAAPLIDRVQVGVPGDRATRGFSPNLSITLESAEGYKRGCCYDSTAGEWEGPAWRNSGSPQIAAPSHIAWSVEHVRSSRTPSSLARAAGPGGYPRVSAGAVKVRHIVGGRTVGRLKAYRVLDAAPAPGAEAQEALVVDLGQRVRSIVLFRAYDPAVDQEGSLGTLTVNGTPASQWNRQQAIAAARNVTVVGPLPPRRVRARGAGRAVKGKVVDGYGHPVAETPVALLSGSRTVAKGVTSTRGTFTLRAPRAGAYRVLARLAGAKARSKTVRLR